MVGLLPFAAVVFAVFGDSRGAPISPIFAKLVEAVNRTEAQFAFHTGDFYSGTSNPVEGAKQVEAYLRIVAKSRIPIYPVMGNHDVSPGTYKPCRERIFNGGPTYYSFDHENCHFVVLDLYEPGFRGRLSPRQWTWLESDLRKARGKHIFVFLHPPLFPVDGHLKSSVHPRQVERLAALFKECGVGLVFCGHEHIYARLVYDGLVQVVTGGAGAPLYRPLPLKKLPYDKAKISAYKAASVHHFCLVKVRGEKVTLEAYDLNGKLFDRFSLKQHRPKG